MEASNSDASAVSVPYRACHLLHGQRVREQPRALPRQVPGVEFAEISDEGLCCGSAGTYNLLQPAAARKLGESKARSILAADPEVVATANPGCALRLGAGWTIGMSPRPGMR